MNCPKKLPAIRIVRLNPFRAISSGPDAFDRVMGDFNAWQEAHPQLIRQTLLGESDFLTGEDGKAEWLWAAADGVTAEDVKPYRLVDFEGGLYACVTGIDNDSGSSALAHEAVRQWLQGSGFESDDRPGHRTLYHMLNPEDALCQAPGCHQGEFFFPVRIKA